jgi:2'-5' RNA ligase
MQIAMPFAEPTGRGDGPEHNLFFALGPPPEAADQIVRLTDPMFRSGELKGPRVARERLHISLNSLGVHATPPRRLIDAAFEAVARVSAPAFVVALDRVVSYGRGAGLKPRVLTGGDGLSGIFMLYSLIHENLVRAGLIRRGRRQLSPHVTLSREAGALPEAFVDPVVWRVREFRLIDSLQGQGRHHVLGAWPLVGCGAQHGRS